MTTRIWVNKFCPDIIQLSISIWFGNSIYNWSQILSLHLFVNTIMLSLVHHHMWTGPHNLHIRRMVFVDCIRCKPMCKLNTFAYTIFVCWFLAVYGNCPVLRFLWSASNIVILVNYIQNDINVAYKCLGLNTQHYSTRSPH